MSFVRHAQKRVFALVFWIGIVFIIHSSSCIYFVFIKVITNFYLFMSAHIFGWSARTFERLHKSLATITLATMVLALAPIGGTQFAQADQIDVGPGGPPGPSMSTVVYDAIPSPLEPNYPSQPFQAQQTHEFGDYVHLADTDRLLNTVTVTLANWAKASTPANQDFCAANAANCDATGFFWPITVNVYSNHLDAGGAPDTVLATKTITTHVPWRPESDPSCGATSNGTGWKDNDICYDYSGIAANASFDLSDTNTVLPDDVIVGFAYNTQTYGAAPTGVDGPYNSLNIAVPPNNVVTVGTDDSADETFWNTSTVGYYSTSCPGNTFCKDTNWTPYGTVAMQITADPVPLPVNGSIEITKYSCPVGTTVNRDDNGVGGAVPEGCRLEEGANFGYVHGTQTDAGAPYPEWSESVTPAGSTDANGVLTVPDVSPVGRYVVFETDNSNTKLADDALFGLYCQGDADPNPNHNDNGDILFVPEGGVGKCVAYNIAPLDVTRPGLVFDYPDANSYHKNTVDVSLTGTDAESGIKSMVVNFYTSSNTFLRSCGSENVTGSPTEHTLTCTLDVSGDPEGDYVLKGGAFDVAGNNKTITQTIHVDHTRPELVFTTPDFVHMLSGLVDVVTQATDVAGIASMVINIKDSANVVNLGSCGSGNSAIGGISPATYACALDTTTYPDGSYYFRAGANDTAGNNKTISQAFSIDNTKPTVVIDSPADASVQVGTFDVNGTASDAGSDIDHVAFTITSITGIGGTDISTVDAGTATYNSTTGEWIFTVDGLVDGYYRLEVQAFDGADNTEIVHHDVQVINVVPALAITAPAMDNDYAVGTYNFTAQYDNGVTTNIQWAIRSGTSCAGSANTVAGNVDGHHDISTLSGSDFTATLNTATWTDGDYCLIVNPKEPSGMGYSDLREKRLFVVDNTATDAPTLVSPENNAVVNGTSITQEWTDASTDIDHYIYESYNDDAATSLRYHATYTTTNKTATNVADTEFWWRVKAVDTAGNESEWSDLWRLVVDSTAVAPNGDTQAHITLVKETVDSSDGTFDFDVTNESEESVAVPEITTDGGVGTSETYDVDPGTYTIAEAAQDGWALTGASCAYTDESGTPDQAEQEDGVIVSLAVGEDVTCTFANEPVSIPVAQSVAVHRGDLAADISAVLDDVTKWFFYNDETDTIDNTLGAFVTGPGTPPLGVGSAYIEVSGTQRRNLATYRFFGTPLSEITALSFDTYNPSAGNGGSGTRSAYLNFNVDFDGSDTWQKRIAFVPSHNGTVQQDTWQTWNAINDGTALWWWSGYSANGNKWPDGNTSEYRSWNSILSAFPNARIRVSDGWFGLRVGEPYADGYNEDIDNFVITVDDGTTATTTTFDFEPDVSTQTVISNATGLASTSSAAGDAYVVQWSVTPTSGNATPTGTVEITVNGGVGCSAPAVDGECSITPSSPGTVTLQAHFTGNPGYDDSESDMTTHEITEVVVQSSGGGGGNGQIVGSSSSAPGFFSSFGVGGNPGSGSGTESSGGGTTTGGDTNTTGGGTEGGNTTSGGGTNTVTLPGGTTITANETGNGGTELTIENPEGETTTINSENPNAADQLAAAQASGVFDQVPDWVWALLLLLLLLGAGGYLYWETVRRAFGL